MEITKRLAEFVSETSYQDIPAEAIRCAKGGILDCLGVALAGSVDPASRLITDYVREEGGRPEAGVIGGGFKALASQAAWANGTISHALDYDDYAISFGGHPTVAILPAVLALGQKYHVSGKEILLAYLVGFEAAIKLGPVCIQHYLKGWHMTSTLGTIGAVAAASKILNLGNEVIRIALGIAASLASGLKQNFGTMTKPLHAGNASRNGVVAAQLAQKGFTADKAILEAPQGYCKVLAGGVDLDLAKIEEGIGKRFDIVSGLAMKPWPSCAGTHSSIEAALYLKKEYHITAQTIEDVECRTSAWVPTAAIHSCPKTGVEGKFSTQYCVARAILDGELGLKHFTDEEVMEQTVQELLGRVRYAHPEGMPVFGSEVVIRLRDGRVLSHRVNSPKGGAEHPMSWEDICSKYRDCASLAISPENVQICLELVSNLESLPDITRLMDVLTFKTRKPY